MCTSENLFGIELAYFLLFITYVGKYNYRPHVLSVQPFLSLRDLFGKKI